VRAGAFGAAAFSASLLLLVAAPVFAQTPPAAALPPPPLPGYMAPYEITRIVRSAGFDPLTRPMREGTTYVVRANDYRGILMRVVVDAQTGAIRAVNRIVANVDPYGPVGVLPPAYAAPSVYGPPEFVVPPPMPREDSAAVPGLPPPAMTHPTARSVAVEPPALPLPRPRPADFAARDPKAGMKPPETPAPKPEVKSTAAGSAKPQPPATLSKPAPPLPIND
jgi:hypothetical protein